VFRENRMDCGAQPPAHAVAADRPAELSGDGQAETDSGIAVSAVTRQQEKWRRLRARAGLRREEIPAFADRNDAFGRVCGPARVQAESRLRPLARRRLTTLRPALVAMRARYPWRRLRTSLLGWYVRFMADFS
jgi:hypothetical protein